MENFNLLFHYGKSIVKVYGSTKRLPEYASDVCLMDMCVCVCVCIYHERLVDNNYWQIILKKSFIEYGCNIKTHFIMTQSILTASKLYI